MNWHPPAPAAPGHQPSQAGRRHGLAAVVLDIDDTLTLDNSLKEINRLLGTSPQAIADLKRAVRDENLSAQDTAAELLSLWTTPDRPITRRLLTTAFERIRLRPGAHGLLREIRRVGYQVCLISSSFDLYTETIARRLGIDEHYANMRLLFDSADVLTGLELTTDPAALKQLQLGQFCEKHSIRAQEVLPVGDGPNDMKMFACTGNGVLLALANNQHLRQNARHIVKDLKGLTRLITASAQPVARPSSQPQPETQTAPWQERLPVVQPEQRRPNPP
ncbi:HAD family hydrolase [Streptomyces lavendulae]|uniref:HAD family hydrolase n=1 Tax=Streptomyces lavendulae TaxID=1914 RepID=UPI0036E45406